MVQLNVGDDVILCASLNDFCGSLYNAYMIKDINISLPPCSITAFIPDCLDFSGINISFGWTIKSDTPLNVCPAMLSGVLGSATTNAQGVASIQYRITQQDLDLYNANPSSFDLAACITNASIDVDNGVRKEYRADDPIIIGPTTIDYTHTLELRMRPWGWYSPNGAASELIKKLSDINGWCLNLASSLTDWEYIKTDIVTDGSDVLLQMRYKCTSTLSSLAAPVAGGVGVIIAKVILILSTLLLILATIGIITDWKFFQREEDPTKSPIYTPPPKELEPGIEDVVKDTGDICFSGLPANPTCGDLSTYANCLKASHVGVYGVLTTINPNYEEFQKTYDKYLDIYTNLAATCNADIPGQTPSEILAKIIQQQEAYIIQIQEDFAELQKLYEGEDIIPDCWIPSPVGTGCILTAKTGKTIAIVSGVVIGGYLIFSLIKK